MANNPETLFGMFQKYATNGKTTFRDWCAFIAWVRKCKPDIDILNTLDVLSPEAYEKAIKPRKEEDVSKEPEASLESPADPDPEKQDAGNNEKEPEKPVEPVKPATTRKKKPDAPKEW